MALMYRETIDNLVGQPPNEIKEYFEIPEIAQQNSVLRNHLTEIENIIYPIRGFKLSIDEHPSTSHPHSQLNLFDENRDSVGIDILNFNNCKSVSLDKIWSLGSAQILKC